MCGIACIVDSRQSNAIPALLEKMNRTASHRGPDGSGSAVFGPIGLGHVRLSIIDLSNGGHQPMSRGGLHISFNGEIYNYRELRQDLEALGEAFVTGSDTEVLLAVLAKWGMSGLERLKGMFAFALYDERSGTLHLVRDRFGKKPLLYAKVGNALYAASEAAQIYAALGTGPKVNSTVALRFLEYGYLNGTAETFFSGLFEVPAGHYLRHRIDGGETEIVQWYDLGAKVVPASANYDEAREKLRDLLIAAVRRRHVADVEIGICLSGGIDSSSIASLSSTLFPGKRLLSVTSYSDEPGFDERKFSRSVVRHFQLRSIEICPDTDDMWTPDKLRELGWYHGQPIPNGSHLNEYHVFRAAHEAGLKVMLDGQGSDEYFGGYGEFWLSAQLELLRAGRIAQLYAGLKARAEAVRLPFVSVLKGFVAAVLRAARPPGRADWLKCHAAPEPPRSSGHKRFLELSLEELTHSSVPFQVHSEDRNSMRWSVESRLPFLDHELVEYVLGLPTEYKCLRGIQKKILRDAVSELPAEIAARRDKIGFASPDARTCLRNGAQIRSSLRDTLARLDSIANAGAVLRKFDGMIETQSNYHPMFFRLLSFDGWQRAFNATW
jgi:asparagine synthase (glutamine-hydrolysing)